VKKTTSGAEGKIAQGLRSGFDARGRSGIPRVRTSGSFAVRGGGMKQKCGFRARQLGLEDAGGG
jgi:hypothetical protein